MTLHVDGHLSIAIASDLHAYDKSLWDKDGAPSHLEISMPQTNDLIHPLRGLKKLIEVEELKADVLICPGDMAHQAMPSAIDFAWRELQNLKRRLNAGTLVTTTGNHDIDSRKKYNDFDPLDRLRTLRRPRYPLGNTVKRNEYLARGFTIFTNDVYRLVLLNSAYHHAVDPEYKNGRISDTSLQELRDALGRTNPAPINILVCHHHPVQRFDAHMTNFADQEVMKGGIQLLHLLGSGDFGSWLIVHGHRHRPSVSYAPGGALAPVIFCAGSLSAILQDEQQTFARNQFYMLSVPIARGKRLNGNFRSWYWHSGEGWKPSKDDSGLPANGGFGAHDDPSDIENAIAQYCTLTYGARPFNLREADILRVVPHIQFMLPNDLTVLINKMRSIHGLHAIVEDGRIIQIGRAE